MPRGEVETRFNAVNRRGVSDPSKYRTSLGEACSAIRGWISKRL